MSFLQIHFEGWQVFLLRPRLYVGFLLFVFTSHQTIPSFVYTSKATFVHIFLFNDCTIWHNKKGIRVKREPMTTFLQKAWISQNYACQMFQTQKSLYICVFARSGTMGGFRSLSRQAPGGLAACQRVLAEVLPRFALWWPSCKPKIPM